MNFKSYVMKLSLELSLSSHSTGRKSDFRKDTLPIGKHYVFISLHFKQNARPEKSQVIKSFPVSNANLDVIVEQKSH